MGAGKGKTKRVLASSSPEEDQLAMAKKKAEDEDRDYLLPLLDRLTAKLGPPLVGRVRAVFIDGETVIKVPLSGEGDYENAREASWNDDFIPLASCQEEMMENGDNEKVMVLRMERVKPVFLSYEEGPDWMGFVDCGQVGYTSDGRLVAYDL